MAVMATLLQTLIAFGIYFIIETSQQCLIHLNYNSLLGPSNLSTVTINVELKFNRSTPVSFTANVYNKSNTQILENISLISEAIDLPRRYLSNPDVLFKFLPNISGCVSDFYSLTFLGSNNCTAEITAIVGSSACLPLPEPTYRIRLFNGDMYCYCLVGPSCDCFNITSENDSILCFNNLSFTQDNSFVYFLNEYDINGDPVTALVSCMRFIVFPESTPMMTISTLLSTKTTTSIGTPMMTISTLLSTKTTTSIGTTMIPINTPIPTDVVTIEEHTHNMTVFSTSRINNKSSPLPINIYVVLFIFIFMVM